jgi:hypothetical protein
LQGLKIENYLSIMQYRCSLDDYLRIGQPRDIGIWRYVWLQPGNLGCIDLLILLAGGLYPLEIKKTASPGREDVRHYRALQRLQLTVGPGGVICLAEQSLPLTEWAFFTAQESLNIY